MTRRLLTVGGILGCLLAGDGVRADVPEGGGVSAEQFEAELGYETGTIELPGGRATIELPESFRFLGAEGSRRLLTDGWGNPPDAAEDVLGMLIPAEVSPLSPDGWGIVVTFEDDGFVDDEDAKSLDFDAMLSEMKKGMAAENEAREEAGFGTIQLVGWAEPPHYDAETHKLYWAKELDFGGGDEHTLNYNIRILGRHGVLVLNAVAGMSQLAAIQAETDSVLAAVEFNDGHRYSDYLPGRDKAATYGVGGLIAGAAAAKAGLFKTLWIGLLAFKKVILAGAVALGVGAKRFFSRSASTPGSNVTPG